jgi:hypothetical protein
MLWIEVACLLHRLPTAVPDTLLATL